MKGSNETAAVAGVLIASGLVVAVLPIIAEVAIIYGVYRVCRYFTSENEPRDRMRYHEHHHYHYRGD